MSLYGYRICLLCERQDPQDLLVLVKGLQETMGLQDPLDPLDLVLLDLLDPLET
jgi:hypothetical protein